MLNNNTVLKIVSLVLAICLWGFVMGEVNPTIRKSVRSIPVEFINLETIEEQDITLVDKDEYTIDVVVKGSRSDLNALETGDIHVTADLYNYSEGEHHIPVEVAVPEGISLEEVKEPEILVTLEPLISIEKKVSVDFTGELEKGMEPGNIVALPDTVEVKGAKSAIEQVYTVCVQIESEKLEAKTKTFKRSPVALDKEGQIVNNVDISANMVEVQAMLYETKEVSLEVNVTGTPDEKYGTPVVTFPKTVVIKGSKDALADVEGITAADIDISNITKPGTIPVELQLPYGVELADSSKNVSVKIELKK